MDQTTEGDRFGALMRAAQEGDSAAYLNLLTELAPLLKRVVRRRNPFLQAADIEDLVQDILLALHSVRATYDPARPFLPWLLTIARNRMIDAARRYVRRSKREVTVARFPETFFHDGTNLQDDGIGDPQALRTAIGGLPRRQRQAVELLKLREMSLQDAASVTGMSVAALKVAVHRGMNALRKSLSVGV